MHIGVDTDRIRQISDAVVNDLVSPSATDGAVCIYCRTWLPQDPTGPTDIHGPQANECENCVEVREALGTSPLAISMVSLYRKPSRLRDILTRYKGRDDRDDPYDPHCANVVQAILGRALLEHSTALEKRVGGFDAIAVVPSTERRPPHPLETIIRSLNLDTPLLSLLKRGDGDMGFRKPDTAGFQTRESHPPLRVLLVDDVYTTGSRLNSAAFALRDAGHTVAASFVLARRINPQYSDEADRMWRAADSAPFDWSTSPWI